LGCITSKAAELLLDGGYNGGYNCLINCDTDVGPHKFNEPNWLNDPQNLVYQLYQHSWLYDPKPDGWLEITSHQKYETCVPGDQLEITYITKCQTLSIELINSRYDVVRRIASELLQESNTGLFTWIIEEDLPVSTDYGIRIIGHWSGQSIEVLSRGGINLIPKPEPLPDPTIIKPLAWTSNVDVQGLMWEKRPDGQYFDIDKPTIIWVHGWSESLLPDNYTRFLYKDAFLSLGYNVGIFRYQKDIIDCLYARWQPWEVLPNTEVGVWRRSYNVMGPPSREYVINAVWSLSGSGMNFRNAINEFFKPVALRGYSGEIMLLTHSTGAQTATLGLASAGTLYPDLKFTLVFLDPWFPPKANVWYTHDSAERVIPLKNGDYNPYEAAKILSYLSNKPNGNVICCVSTYDAGTCAKHVLKHHLSSVFDKATHVNDTNPTDLSEECKYARRYNNTYWDHVFQVAKNPEGNKHFHAIDFFCKYWLQRITLPITGLYFDNGTSQVGPEWNVAGGMYAVQFTPPFDPAKSPYKLLEARIFVHALNNPSAPIRIHILDDAFNDLTEPIELTVHQSEAQTWISVDVTSRNIVLATDFFIASEQLVAGDPGIGSDTNYPRYGRSWDYNAVSWSPQPEADYMIRALLGPMYM
jgi:hypothetical protein